MGLDDLLNLDGSYFALRKDHNGPQFYLQRRRQLLLAKFSSAADPSVSQPLFPFQFPIPILHVSLSLSLSLSLAAAAAAVPAAAVVVGLHLISPVNCPIPQIEEEAAGTGLWETSKKVNFPLTLPLLPLPLPLPQLLQNPGCHP